MDKAGGEMSWDKPHDSAMVTLLAVLQLSASINLQGK